MLRRNPVEIYGKAAPAWRLVFWILLGAIAAMGQAPFGMPLLSLLGFGLGIAAFARLRSLLNPLGVGWAFGLGYFLVTLNWLVSPFLVDPETTGWMAPFGLFLMCAGLALFWAVAFWLAARLGRVWSLVISLSLAELARAYVLTGFAWGMPSYGLVDRALGQAASWIGPHGLNIVVFGLAWGLACVLLFKGRQRIFAALVVLGGASVMLLPAPEARIAPKDAAIIRVIQPNAPQHEKWDPDKMPEIFERALALTRSEAQEPVALTIWPESSLPDILNYSDDLLAQINQAAGFKPVVLGANRLGGVRIYNSAVLLDETGAVAQLYDKHHLVPFGEYIPFGDALAQIGISSFAPSFGSGFSPGPGAQLMDLGPLGYALPLICYEVVFPQDVRSAHRRPEFLMQITNDAWFGTFSGPYQSLVQAQMRAIETGLPMVRAANTGVSAMIDARGRIVGSLPLNEAGFLDVALQAPMPQPLYAWMGDTPICVFLLLVLAGCSLSRRRESP